VRELEEAQAPQQQPPRPAEAEEPSLARWER
jgi:hypothetical protein